VASDSDRVFGIHKEKAPGANRGQFQTNQSRPAKRPWGDAPARSSLGLPRSETAEKIGAVIAPRCDGCGQGKKPG
jgi:hypothetical protein